MGGSQIAAEAVGRFVAGDLGGHVTDAAEVLLNALLRPFRRMGEWRWGKGGVTACACRVAGTGSVKRCKLMSTRQPTSLHTRPISPHSSGRSDVCG